MANVLSDEKKQQVLALGSLGWPLRRIEEATGVRRETASRYLKAAGIGIRPPGGWGRKPPGKPANGVATDSGANSKSANEASTDSGAEPNPANEVSTDLESETEPANGLSAGSTPLPPWPVRPTRSPAASACEAHREFIEAAVSLGRNAMAIWQDLVDDHEFTAGYASVKRFVARLRGTSTLEAHPVITTAPGEEAQVDYGEGPMVRHQETGKYRRTRLFVFTLGCSRKSVRLLTFRSSSKIWAELHEKAFRRLGGATRTVVLDNLREGVLKPDIYDATLNPLFRDVLKHYGAVALPCRVRDPDRKGKVESGVNHAQQKLRGLRFESLEEAQAYLDRWEERWADTRIHGTTKRQVAAMFEDERPYLQPLPLEPFRYYSFGQRTVHLDGCVEVEAAYYAPPPGFIGQVLHVQWDERVVRLIDPKTGQLLREHLRQQRGGRRIRPEDRPSSTPPTTRELLQRGQNAGKSVGTMCAQIHSQQGESGVRQIQGLLSLVKRHGAANVDEACSVGLEVGSASYRFVKRYLEHRAPLQDTLRQVDPLIRQLTEYRDLVDRIATRRTTG